MDWVVKRERAMGGLKLWMYRLRYYLFLGLTLVYPPSVVGFLREFENLQENWLALFNIVITAPLYFLVRKEGISLGKFFSRVISGNVSSLGGIYTIVVFLVALSMSTDKFAQWIDSGNLEKLYLATTYLFTGINTAILFILSQSYFYRKDTGTYTEPERKKVLIAALSLFKYGNEKGNNRDETLKKFLEEIKNKKLDDSKAPWAVPLRSIKHHVVDNNNKPILEKVILLVSEETSSKQEAESKVKTYNFNDFKLVCREFCKLYGVKANIEIVESRPVNFNSIQDCLSELHRLLRVEVFPRYKDEDISMNISSGTAIVSAAMVIASVKEGRQIEYIEQTEGKKSELLGMNVSVQDIYTFYPEIKG